MYDAIVIGSGLAGMSAAVNLTEKGKKVIVLEKGRDIGGRTSSWVQDGMELESGLHRYLGFYEALPQLMGKVGVEIDDIIVWEDEIEIRMPDGKPSAVFSTAPLVKPGETIASLIFNNDFLPFTQKANVTKFFVIGLRDFNDDPKDLDNYTVFEYAKNTGLSEEVIEKILVPLTEGLFFLSVKKYSALNFFALFNPYLIKLHKTRVGAFAGGMAQVMMKPLADFVIRKGGGVSTNSKVEEIAVKDNVVTGVKTKDKEYKADAVVLAASIEGAKELVKNFSKESYFENILNIPTMPSVTLQMELSEPSMIVDRTTFSPGTSLLSYAEQSRTTFKDKRGRLSTILGPAKKLKDKSNEELLEIVLKDAQRVGIKLNKENVLSYDSVIWPSDFYSFEKGTYQNRPVTKTPIQGLVLAGDYTKQEYLQTMEGAVVSGKIAADIVLSEF